MKNTELQLIAKQILLVEASRRRLEGDAPSEEELAALLDDRLEFGRRQQIYAYLNSSPELMERWVRLVETHHDLKCSEKGGRKAERGGLSAFYEWFGQWRALSLGSAAAVMILGLGIVLTQPQSPDRPPPLQALGAVNQQQMDREFSRWLSPYETGCTTKLEAREDRGNLYDSLSSIKKRYETAGYAMPPELANLSQQDFLSAVVACSKVKRLLVSLPQGGE